jgi:hypothetical protein
MGKEKSTTKDFTTKSVAAINAKTDKKQNNRRNFNSRDR